MDISDESNRQSAFDWFLENDIMFKITTKKLISDIFNMKDFFKNKQTPTTCPKCEGKVVKIIYGMPVPEMEEAADRGEIILGGCCIALDEHGKPIVPEWGCVKCGERF